MLEAAAIWYARLREPANNSAAAAARQADFEGWLNADPRHRRAFEETQRLWNKLDAPVTQVMTQDPASVPTTRRHRCPARRRLPRPLLMAACLTIVIAAGLVYQGDFLLWLNSDYSTAIGQRMPLRLNDGSRVTLNTDSAIAVDMTAKHRHIRLLQGEAWFNVTPDSKRPLLVETATGQAHVTGTSFGVRLRGDTTVVSLAAGSVTLSAHNGPDQTASLALHPGQQARLSAAGVSAPSQFNKTAVTAWLRGQIVFFNTPLRAVIAELNRYRRGYIVIANGKLETLKISGVFATDDPNAALAAIAATLPVRIIRLTDYLVLLR
jgi:transmembrane sensor